MENKNPMVRLITYGKVKKMMLQFKNSKIDQLEKNMMRGMFLRKLKDFAEQLKNQKISLLERFIRAGNHEEDEIDELERSELIEKL
jgi:hypothetical protein